MKIALVDDDRLFLEKEKQIIMDMFSQPSSGPSIAIFSDVSAFLEVWQQHNYFAVFLDIDMPEISGFQVAKKLRQTPHKDTHIFFVSHKEQLVFESFNYHPIRFIRKDYIQVEMRSALSTLLKKYQAENKCIVVKVEGDPLRLRINDIIYFESNVHILSAYTLKGVFEFRDQIGTKEAELLPFGFVRIHSGYLVNLRFVENVFKYDLRLSNGDSLPISRSKYPQAIEKFQEYLSRDL